MSVEPGGPDPTACRIPVIAAERDRRVIPLHALRRTVACPGCVSPSRRVHRRSRRQSLVVYYPAKVSRHLQLRLEQLPKPIQDLSWKAQVRLCTRDRQRMARGKHANQVVGALVRE